MDVSALCRGIGLREEAQNAMKGVLTKKQYLIYIKLYEQDHEKCFQKILQEENPDILFLAFYCRAACGVYEKYLQKGIGQTVFFDTFRDIVYWCENCSHEFGHYGIHQYDWFWRHIDMTLFRLGRLEFELMDFPHGVNAENIHILEGERVINIHVPQGSKLYVEECRASVKNAHAWFGTKLRYVCHSWLLYPRLSEILVPESNIIQFQGLFKLLETDFNEREAEWRIFGKLREYPSEYPQNSSLQKKARKYLMDGGRLGNGLGLYTG